MLKISKALYRTGGVLFLTLFTGVARADQTPLLRGPDVDQATLEAFARTEDRTTLAEYYDANRPQKANEDRLTRLLERAQSQWVSGTIDTARATFRELANLLLEDDWREAHREAIAYAMVRLAQSSASPIESNEWIEKAVDSVPDYQPDATLFPPPLIKSLNDARSRHRVLAREVNLSDSFSEYRFVLINGKKYEVSLKKIIRLPPGPFRVTALSDVRAPITQKLTSTELARFKAASPPLALGSCKAPEFFDVPRYSGPLSILFSDRCVRSRADTEKPRLALSDLTPERSNEAKWPTAEKPAEIATWKKAAWIALGVSALTAGVLIVTENSKPRRSVEPTVREGY